MHRFDTRQDESDKTKKNQEEDGDEERVFGGAYMDKSDNDIES